MATSQEVVIKQKQSRKARTIAVVGKPKTTKVPSRLGGLYIKKGESAPNWMLVRIEFSKYGLLDLRDGWVIRVRLSQSGPLYGGVFELFEG